MAGVLTSALFARIPRRVCSGVLASAVLLCWTWPVAAAGDPLRLKVLEPYAELHTGPGRGYPVTQVIERGGEFVLVKRRTDWFLVESEDGERGWMPRHAVEAAEDYAGRPVSFARAGRNDWDAGRVELGFAAGDFDGDRVFGVRAAWRLARNFALEGGYAHAAGTFSGTTVYHLNLQVLPFVVGRVAPYLTLGAAWIENEPKTTLVDAEAVEDWAGNAGLGVRAWLTRRFILRGDFRQYVFTRDVNNNDDFTEVALGFSIFF
ncbi:MAG: outer membrane beta-barrel protein [Gammaproteobacteria bacterium]